MANKQKKISDFNTGSKFFKTSEKFIIPNEINEIMVMGIGNISQPFSPNSSKIKSQGGGIQEKLLFSQYYSVLPGQSITIRVKDEKNPYEADYILIKW